MLTDWISQNLGAIYFEMLLLFSVALIITSIGFYRPLYFINIGYAFAIIGMVVVTLIRHVENISFVSVAQNLLLVLWGLRLGLYLIKREFQSAYNNRKIEIHEGFAKMPLGVRFIIWITVSILYVLMFSPSLFRLTETPETTSWILPFSQGLGLLLMGGGLVLESIADKQKSDFKTMHPKRYCDIGLYRRVRSPNYLGEIVFWVGSWVVGTSFYTTPMQWAISLVGLFCIVWIMMYSTKRLEKTQDERYGDMPEYQQYVQSVPILFPFVPVYSLKKSRALLN